MTLDEIAKDLEAGLEAGRDRRDCARANEDFYRGRNLAHLQRREGETPRDFDQRPKRFSRLTRKAINELSRYLYSPGPTREASDATAQAFLEVVWETTRVDNLLKQADRKATLNGACAVQVACTGDPGEPVRLWLWGAEEFEPLFSNDDPIRPWAVCTIAVQKEGRRCRRVMEAWTDTEHRTYATDWTQWASDLGTMAGRAFKFVGAEDNPYGVLPFAFVWDEVPVADFWEGGIGTLLRQTNEQVDEALCDLAEHTQRFLNPRWFLRHVAADFRWADRAGQPTHLPPAPHVRGGESNGDPDIFVVQPQLGVEAAWWDVRQTIQQCFYELDVPLNAVRDESAPTSGVQVVAESKDLLQYTIDRRPKVAWEEAELAKVVLRASGAYYELPALAAAAEGLTLAISWPEVRVPIPSADQDQADQFEMANNLESAVGLIMRRRGLSRDEAIAHLEQVAADNEMLRGLFPPVDPMTGAVIDPEAEGGDQPEGEGDGQEG